MLDLRDQGIIGWEWIEGIPLNPAYNTKNSTLLRPWEHFQRLSGRKTGKVMGMVLHWLESDEVLQDQKLSIVCLSSTEFLINSTLIRIRRPLASVEILKKGWCEQLVLVPHWTRRGPNGLWVITRGPKHPLVINSRKA
ncbi:MAG TPA: hypothetical protein DD706_15465 [Nitrospiraceae bacterium]|nr:hypothetical protein [Nitrospiraceae bacterium]